MRLRLMAAVLAGGCSLLTVRGPSADDPLRCTVASAAPTADVAAGLVVGALTLAVGAAAASFQICIFEPCEDDPITGSEWATIGAFTLLFSVPFFVSSAVGSSRMGRCHDAYRARGLDPYAPRP